MSCSLLLTNFNHFKLSVTNFNHFKLSMTTFKKRGFGEHLQFSELHKQSRDQTFIQRGERAGSTAISIVVPQTIVREMKAVAHESAQPKVPRVLRFRRPGKCRDSASKNVRPNFHQALPHSLAPVVGLLPVPEQPNANRNASLFSLRALTNIVRRFKYGQRGGHLGVCLLSAARCGERPGDSLYIGVNLGGRLDHRRRWVVEAGWIAKRAVADRPAVHRGLLSVLFCGGGIYHLQPQIQNVGHLISA